MPTVFISYRQIDSRHKARVRRFGENLRACGIDVILDQFYANQNPGGPDEGWPKWSEDQAAKTDRVIIMASEAWFQCFDGTQKPGSGLGAACEAGALRQRLYDNAGLNRDIRIACLDENDAEHVPLGLKRYHRFHAKRDLAAIVKWLGGTTRGEPPDAGATEFINLPRLPFFFGRETELARIADALKPEKEQLWGALISGPGGVGKTSLAIKAARCAGGYDRVLFLTAKSRQFTSEGPKVLSGFVVPGYLAMLNEIGRLLERPELVRTPAADRPRAAIQALRSQRTLLVLDNLETLAAEDQNDVLDFVEHLPRGCKAILTARRFAYESGRPIDLAEGLDKEASLKLLDELALDRPLLAKADKKTRVALYEETGGNPLLIRWVVGQLQRGKCVTIAKALAFLKKAPADNDPLAFIFGDLVDTLSPSELRAIRGLSGLSRPCDVKTLVRRAKLSQRAAYTVVNDLADRGLVNSDPTREFFSVLPVVVAYLNEITRRAP